ncbi:MAG TPA: hypothetical protein VME01_07915 [Solirubrobacteraceae bacterium]|nr:hypothetical protein [Solirubrobacteraceae bacterium]
MDVRSDPQVSVPGATPEEAAAITAAIRQFARDTTPQLAGPAGPAQPGPWLRAALLEGVNRQP